MIEALRIKDFQSIEELSVNCGPITVIYGESDTGKSAVVRALYALAHNSYPKEHVRDGADRSHVSVQTTIKGMPTVVSAEKGSGTNSYRLTTADPSESMEWDRVGTDVPAEVMDALGWGEVELDDGSRFTPSFQRQFDPPFLLTDSPSRRAKVLGSLTNVATLFAAIKEANAWERKAKVAADTHAEMLGDLTPKIEQLESSVDRLQALGGSVGEHIAGAREVALKANALTAMLLSALAQVETVKTAERIIEMMPDVDTDEIDQKLAALITARSLYERWWEAANEEVSCEHDLDDANSAWHKAAHELDQFDSCPVCGGPL